PPGTCGKPPGSFDAFPVAVLANSGLVHVLDGEVVVAGNVGECAGDDGGAVCAICEHVDGGVEFVLVGVVEVVEDDGECAPVVAGRGSETVQDCSSLMGAYVGRAMVTWWPSWMHAAAMMLRRLHASAAACSGMSSICSSRSVRRGIRCRLSAGMKLAAPVSGAAWGCSCVRPRSRVRPVALVGR